MKSQNRKWFLFVSLVLVIALVACSAPTKPTIKFTPISGQINAGQEVTIQATAADAKGISRIEFSVDGTTSGEAKVDPPQKNIIVPYTWIAVAGQHTISARVINMDGLISDPDTMVLVVTGAPGPVPTGAPTQPAPTLVPTPVGPTPTLVPGPCSSNAAFIADVTVPDGTQWHPNQQFNKIWRVQNAGSCTWTSKYQLAYISGDRMTNISQIAVPTNVAPGQTVDLLVAMTAPANPGKYTGQWQLRDESNTFFGPVLRVVINVVLPAPPPQVAVTSPGNGFQFTAGTTVHVTFQGNSTTELASVSLYINGALQTKQTSRTPTRQITGAFDWQPGVGNYTLYAVAVDILGQQSTSAQIVGVITQQPCPVSINFRADRTSINAGEHTMLRWDVDCVKAVYLDGQGVGGHEARDVAPTSTKTYTLHVIKNDNSGEDRQVTINVTHPVPPTPVPPTPVPQRRNINGTWRAGDYTVELTEALGCSSAECGIAGRMIHQIGTTTPQIVDVHGQFHVYSGAVSFAAMIPGGQSFSGTVSADSRTMSGTLSGVGGITFTKQ